MTSTVKPKAKFSSRNLSAVYKAPSPSFKPSDNAGGFYPSANRMLVIGRSPASSAAAPAPLNTPSLRKEHHQSPGPTGSPARAGWAVPSAVTPLRLHESASDADAKSPAQPEPLTHAPSEQGNVWASGHVAEIINPEVAHHHAATAPTDATGAAGGRATGRFARSPFVGMSGRWGDDAVEQDIERQDREKEMRRHREFPDLKEAAQLAAPHHEERHDGGGHFPDHRRFDMDRPASRFDHFERSFHRDDDYRPPYHNDRFGRDGGYGRFDGPRRFEAPPAPVGGGAHSHFSPSDARFDGFMARHEVERALPSFGGGGSRAGSSHGSTTSASDLDVSHRYPSPPHYSFIPEDNHRHYHEDVARSPSHPVAPELPTRSVEQPFHSREDLRSSSVEHEDRYHGSSAHDEPVNWRQRPNPREVTRSDRLTVASTAPPVGSEVEHGDGDKHERKNSSLSRTSSSSSASKPNSNAAGSSSNSQPAVGSPQVRILKRMEPAPNGPKMLFDPKTGGMVSAEKEEAAPAGRRRKQQQQTIEKKPSAEVNNTPAVKEDAAKVLEEVASTTKTVATLLVGDMELPIHDEPPASFRIGIDTKDDEQPASEATMELKSHTANESSSTSIEVSSLEIQRDGKKSNPRRREAATSKPSKAPARGKPEAHALERVKANEQRSRSESVEKKPKRESRQAASASPSVPPAAGRANHDREKKERRPPKSKSDQDSRQVKQRTRGAGGEAETNTERRANPPRSDVTTATKQETRTVAVTDKPSNRSARHSRRSGKREAHADRQQSENATPIEASTSLKDDKGGDHGFQTVKSRRVVLSEKKQQRQQEPPVVVPESKPVATADGSTRSRKQKVRKAEQEAESKVAPVKSEAPAPAAAKSRSARRSERQAGGEQASEKPHTSTQAQRSSRRHSDEQQGPDGKPSAAANEAVGSTAKPARGKRKMSNKGKPSEETAMVATSDANAASKSDRHTTPSAASTLSVAAPATVKPASKTETRPQRKPAGRKVYVAKAPPAPALSAA